MALTVGFMILGFTVSILSIHFNKDNLIYLGLAIIASVCVSWWFWVMFIIRSMVKHGLTTLENMDSIRYEIKEIKKLLSR